MYYVCTVIYSRLHIVYIFYVFTVNCSRLHTLYIHFNDFMFIPLIAEDHTHYIYDACCCTNTLPQTTLHEYIYNFMT